MAFDLTPCEAELLIYGLNDDVALVWVLIHLGVRKNPSATSNWRPTKAELDGAFATLRKLVDAELVRIGRMEYIDGGPPGRVAPVKHVSEELEECRSRVDQALLRGIDQPDWEYACWVVNTEKGDAMARRFLGEEDR